MLYLIIILFALAAVLGLTMLIRWLTSRNASRAVIYSHGIAAATALVLLVIYALQNKDHFPQVSLILFILAAIGGFYLFANDIGKGKHPVAVAVIHALLAVGGFVALLLFVFA